MRIANPIYDVVFKYLMDDNKIAKLLISKIVGEEIESIDFQPTENIFKIGGSDKDEEKPKVSFTVYRLDFAAKIRTAEGELKQVIIEIQKAKLPTDIMRFRRYLGKQYSSEQNSETVKENGIAKTKAFPIISIYFLGHFLNFETAPVIKVSRTYTDIATGELLKNKEEFIESLTHDSYIIQIPALIGKRRNELEKLLSIFDQSQKESKHILNVNEEEFPEEYREIIRKLQKAVVDEDIQNTMDIEDEVIQEISNREREIENLKDVLIEKDHALIEKENALSEKDHALTEKDKALSEKDNALSEKDNALSEKDNALSEFKLEIERLKKLLGKQE